MKTIAGQKIADDWASLQAHYPDQSEKFSIQEFILHLSELGSRIEYEQSVEDDQNELDIIRQALMKNITRWMEVLLDVQTKQEQIESLKTILKTVKETKNVTPLMAKSKKKSLFSEQLTKQETILKATKRMLHKIWGQIDNYNDKNFDFINSSTRETIKNIFLSMENSIETLLFQVHLMQLKSRTYRWSTAKSMSYSFSNIKGDLLTFKNRLQNAASYLSAALLSEMSDDIIRLEKAIDQKIKPQDINNSTQTIVKINSKPDGVALIERSTSIRRNNEFVITKQAAAAINTFGAINNNTSEKSEALKPCLKRRVAELDSECSTETDEPVGTDESVRQVSKKNRPNF